MRSRLACCDSDPRRALCGEGARLAATSIRGEFGGNAHDLKREERGDPLAGDAIAFADRLVAEQDDRAWPLRTLIAER